ncbi:chemotaxis protein CheW [Imhoffiella purpurea]|uniref:CheW-like domain-containing protein n=1 Tax=Imhoffiella purpurea TaxID=1249627 RepID=W9V5C0_9GAMM|nr:chemotaxis protein CheW [Imhoffiella purpurea]EXJ14743.1 hypothetical protein D779_2272 [Imhoffiella purpurea]
MTSGEDAGDREPGGDGRESWAWILTALDAEELDQQPGEVRYAFRIGSWWFLVPLDLQAEVAPRQTCSRLPFTPTWCLGLSNYRGDLVPVYELGELIEERRGPGTGSYFLMLGRRDRRAGLCIDEIRSLRIPPDTGSVPLYPMRNFPDDLECRGIRIEGTLFAEVDLAEILGMLTERASLLGTSAPCSED